MNIDASGPVKNCDAWYGMIPGRVRSYRCSFCERGFSNAQALGGHMNIHRKDRAKLRGFSDENFLSLDITKASCDSSVSEVIARKLGCPDGKPEDLGFGSGFFTLEKEVEKRKMELINHGEVDLELRLGFKPHDPKMSGIVF